MSVLSRWLLIPPVSARLSERYQGYRMARRLSARRWAACG